MYRVMLSYGLKLHKGLQVVVKPPPDWRHVLKQIRQSQVTVGTFVPKDEVSLWQRVTGLKFFVAIEGPDPNLKALPGSSAMGIQAYNHQDGASQYKAEVIRLRLGKQPRKRRWVQQEQWQGDTWSVPRQQVEVELEPLDAEPLPPSAFPDVAIPSNGFVQGEVVDFGTAPEREEVRRRPSVKPQSPEPSRRIQAAFNRFRPQVRSNGVILSETELEENRLAAEAEQAARAAAYRDQPRDDADYADDDYLPPSNAVLGFRDRETEVDAGWTDRRDADNPALAADEDSDAEDDYGDDWDNSLDQLAASLPSNAVVGRLRDDDNFADVLEDEDAWVDDDRTSFDRNRERDREPARAREADDFVDDGQYDDDLDDYDDSLDDYAEPPRRRPRGEYDLSNLPSNGVVMTFDDDPDMDLAEEEDDWDEEDY